MASNRVYGIDLGTTYSCIAYVDENGKPVVVPNSDNQLTTPSVVYFEGPEKIAVGEHAKEVAKLYPDRVASGVKRFMGDPSWLFTCDGRDYRPQQISEWVLRKLVGDAESVTGDKIRDVVITVPAYFGVNQREATRQAGELAGLNVLHLIPEPTAAAIAYGMENETNQVVLVYDLGGGTFDITLIAVEGNTIRVLCTHGDDRLGGKDWDQDIVGFLAQRFCDEHGTPPETLLRDPETAQELLSSAERLKTSLSSRDSVVTKVRFGADDLRVDLTRSKFEELTAHRLSRTISLTEELLETARSKGFEKVDKLLLVGGSTYMPQVAQAVKARFPYPVQQWNPNQAVAMGAAIFGYKCFLEEKLRIKIAEQTGQEAAVVDLGKVDAAELERAQKQVSVEQGVALPALRGLLGKTIINVTSKSFGVVVVEASSRQEKVNNLITVDDQVPAKVTKVYGTVEDGQDGVAIRCMQNRERVDSETYISLETCEELGSTELRFERPLPAGSPVEITFQLTEDGTLRVNGRDQSTGRDVEAEYKTESIMTREEIENSRSRSRGIQVS